MSWGVWVAVAGCAALLGRAVGTAKERAKNKGIRREAEEKAQRELLETIHLQRHDLMNDLQVLLGYIQLNKQERVKTHVEQMAFRLQEDSAIARLDDSQLTSLLYAWRAGAHQVKLRTHIEHGVVLSELGGRGRLMAITIAALVPCWKAAMREGLSDETTLAVSVAMPEGRLQTVFEYEHMFDMDKLEQLLRRELGLLRDSKDGGDALQWELADGRLSVRV